MHDEWSFITSKVIYRIFWKERRWSWRVWRFRFGIEGSIQFWGRCLSDAGKWSSRTTLCPLQLEPMPWLSGPLGPFWLYEVGGRAKLVMVKEDSLALTNEHNGQKDKYDLQPLEKLWKFCCLGKSVKGQILRHIPSNWVFMHSQILNLANKKEYLRHNILKTNLRSAISQSNIFISMQCCIWLLTYISNPESRLWSYLVNS